MEDNAKVIQAHNHWLRLACTQPLSAAFFALLHRLLVYTNQTMFAYKGGAPPSGEPSLSIAQIAADSSNNQSTNARAYIESVFDQLFAVCILASWLLGEGDPRHATLLKDHPNRVMLTPGWDIDDNDRLMRPVKCAATELVDMTPEQHEAMLLPPRFQAILATANRFYHDPEKRNGCVLGVFFLVLVDKVPEIRSHVERELRAEGINEADCAAVFTYISDEMRAFALANMDFQNAHEYWSTTWSSVTHTLRNNDFARMHKSVRTRTAARDDIAAAVKQSTEKKRQSRATKRQRKKDSRSAKEEENDHALAAIAGVAEPDDVVSVLGALLLKPDTDGEDEDVALKLGAMADTLPDDDDDDNDDLTGILCD